MEKKSQTIKRVVLIIIILIAFCFVLSIVYLNITKENETIESIPDVERIVLENLSYEMIEDNVYNIYDSTDTYITTVYSNDELEYYIQNPDYRPIYNDGDDDEQITEESEEI